MCTSQGFAVIVTLSSTGGPIPCSTGFAVLATVTFVGTTQPGAQVTATLNVSLTCSPFAPTSPYRFTFVDEGDGSVQVRGVRVCECDVLCGPLRLSKVIPYRGCCV